MNKRRDILILGGGTAGWMAANLMAKKLAHLGVKVRLLESPDVEIVGVGEGSTPQFKALFDQLEIAESDWMPRCNASYKVGISFEGWSSKAGFSEYFHPFPAKTDRDTAQAFVYNSYLRRQGLDVSANPNHYFLPAYLAAQERGPKPDECFPFPVSYGYHFDSYLVGEVLRDNAISLGVEHVQDTVVEVQRAQNGDIESLIGKSQQEYKADFFVDCTGFASLLIGKTLGTRFQSFESNLFNDRAVVMSSVAKKSPKAQTVSSAMSAGWAWDIPLTNRTGNGYVYSSKYIDDDVAEGELRQKLGLLDSDVDVRHLKMRVGQFKQHWSQNCLAVGLSQGFIEPLEATALHLAQDTVENFIACLSEGRLDSKDRAAFNRKISARFEGIRDYIVCHYKVNSRSDSEYWRDNAANTNISDSLESLLSIWKNGKDLSVEIDRQGIAQYYPTLSWHCLLAGYGLFPRSQELISDDPRASRFNEADVRDFNRRCALNFKPHTSQLPSTLR